MKSFEEILEEIESAYYPRQDTGEMDAYSYEEQTLSEAIDTEIIMHRDIHFGGSFPIMIEYYENEGVGVQENIPIERIRYLYEVEIHTGNNLAPYFLNGSDIERVALAKDTYEKLRELYDLDAEDNRDPLLIADLILSEEEEPEAEILAIAERGGSIVASLIQLLKSDLFSEPFFPGYGLAPLHAATCLGRIADPQSVIPLFEALCHADFYAEEYYRDALIQLGDPAKEFLLDVMASSPITADNQQAASALMAFKDSPEVSQKALELLETGQDSADGVFGIHLVLLCEQLVSKELRKRFEDLLKSGRIPSDAEEDARMIIDVWSRS